MAIPSGLRYLTSRLRMLQHRFIVIAAGMGCYFLPSPFWRLLGGCMGVWTGWLALYGNWIRLKGSEEMLAEGRGKFSNGTMLISVLGIGLVIVNLLKYLNHSINPFWASADAASGGWNKTGLVLGALSLAEYAYRPLELFPAPPITNLPEKKDQTFIARPTKLQQYLISLGFGALIHLIQTFITDAGTIIAWTWTGYPINGPTLHPFAGVIIAAASVGLVLGVDPFSPTFAALGCMGAIVLYALPDWPGFLGGIMLVIYLMAVLPHYIRAASACSPASTFGNALLVKCILDVLSVVTAAYAFVPYGHLLRERTDLVLGFSMSCIVLGGLASRQLTLPGAERLQLRSRLRMKVISRWTMLASVTLSILACAVSYEKMPTSSPEPYYPNHRIFSGGIWTVSWM